VDLICAATGTRAKGAIPLVGVRTVAQAEANLAALSWQLSPAEVQALDDATRRMKGETIQNSFQTA
jgi:aryl-alcohol dehydrogenase-like predicted oxidoreductase